MLPFAGASNQNNESFAEAGMDVSVNEPLLQLTPETVFGSDTGGITFTVTNVVSFE